MNTPVATVRIPQTFDHDIYSIDPGVQLRALERMKQEAEDAALLWEDNARQSSGVHRQGALMNAADAWRRYDMAVNALRQLGDA